METLLPYLIQAVISLSATVGGVKVAMNGIHRRLDRTDERMDNFTSKMERKVDKLEVKDATQDVTLERLKTIADIKA